jgi:hypothetical protein
MQILNQIEKQLTDVVQTGKMAKLQVVTPIERIKKAFR